MRSSVWSAVAIALCGFGLADPAWTGDDKPGQFDKKVRADFMLGMGGDTAALERGIKLTEEKLKENPQQPEALAWQAASLWHTAGKAYRDGDSAKWKANLSQSLAKFDEAVQLAPENMAVRGTRGAMMLQAMLIAPESAMADLTKRAREDYTWMWEKHKTKLQRLSPHVRGELMMGMTTVLELDGKKDEAKALIEKAAKDLKGTPYGLAAAKLASGEQGVQRTCMSCHSDK